MRDKLQINCLLTESTLRKLNKVKISRIDHSIYLGGRRSKIVDLWLWES